jgi:Tfp pilus assembly protein PilF
MNDGFQSAYPPQAATSAGGGRGRSGAPSPEADIETPLLTGRGRRDSRVPARPAVGAEPPLPRWRGERAELPALRSQLARAELARDVGRERLIAAALARALIKRRAELDIAVRLGRRAVLLGDETLRMDLASWHCQLGQTELAVGMLAPLLELPDIDRARLAMRIALYHARLGDAEQALGALREAAAHDPADALVYELMATVHGWAPWATSPERAADAYLRGAAGRLQHKDTQLAFQDTLRAFDTAPAHAGAASALARAFEARRQPAHADEVWRRHAAALLGHDRVDEALEVQRGRHRRLVEAGRLEEAFAAALDARLDAELDVETILGEAERALAPGEPEAVIGGFDALLCRLELWELLAARLELAAEAASGPMASRCRLVLGNLLERKLGNTERALEPWMQAVVADPMSEAARANLRRYAAATGDLSPLVEALLRVGGQDHRNAPDGAGDCLRELWLLAEERLDDPALASWCVRRALRHEPRADDLARADERWAAPARAAEAELELALEALEALEGDARVPVLRQAAAALRGFPARSARYEAVLWELSERRPGELRLRRLLESVLTRHDDAQGLARLWTRDLVDTRDPNLAVRALLGLARIERRTGNLQGSLAVLAADDDRGLSPAASLQLCLAAQLGNRRSRADALLKLGAHVAPGLRAWLASVAAAELLDLGERGAALSAAEVGTRADPAALRPIVAYADAAEGSRDRVAAVAYERAMALTFPSSEHCKALVEVLEALGEPYAAQVWTARWLSLRPAETAAAVQLLRGSARTGDAARLGDVIAWTISQAHPLAEWAEPLANALTCLVECDRARAADVAWRILDAFGPSPPALRDAILGVAAQSQDAELEVAVLERELAIEGPGVDDTTLWRLADKHFERGEADRGHAVVVRALAAGLDARRALELLDASPESHSAEGEFHRLEARARALELVDEGSDACRLALRQYGAALWDLARDQPRAIEVWLRAAEQGGVRGWFQLARDLVEVLGLERALDEVCRLAEGRGSPEHVAALLTAAAAVSLGMGGRRRALQLGLLALDTDPSNIWALEIIEGAAGGGDSPSLERAYKQALGATLGAYGERALHYRAARFFERRQESSQALSHAVAAFRAVPAEGVSFALLLRLAHGTRETEIAARAVEEVAAEQRDPNVRSQWLRRAALIAGGSADGAQQRMEVLLRALLAVPDSSTVDLLGRAFTDLSRQQPDGRAIGHMRFERAVAKLVPRLEGEDGARVVLGMARVALECFSDARLAFQALARAVRLAPELEELGEFVADAPRLAAEAAAAQDWLGDVEQVSRGGELGSLGLLELAGEIALGVGRTALGASYLARLMQRGPENDALRQRTEQAVSRSREPALPRHVHALFPGRARVAELLARAEAAAAAGDTLAELSALSQAFELDRRLAPETALRLFDLAVAAGEVPLCEAVLDLLERSELDPESVLGATRKLASLLMTQHRAQRALTLLSAACGKSPDDAEVLGEALAAARAAGDDSERQRLLERAIERTADIGKRAELFDEAWEVAKKRGQPEPALDILRRWLAADPEDARALSRLEAEHEARQDWVELVELLGRHLALGVSFRERRRLTLWRTELLESKLGRLAEARDELGALVEQAPGDRTVVERFAQVTELLGDHAAAAAAWLAASGLSSTRPAAAQLAERACRLYLDSGEVMAARRVLAAPQTLPRTLGLARLGVRLERDGENDPRLARALEELGAVEDQPARERADAWLEAAELWCRLGDEPRAAHCANEAARLIPDDAGAQLRASELSYRAARGTAPDSARRVVERLQRGLAGLSAEQADVAGFLLADALDTIGEHDAALQGLRGLRERLGASPLVSLGLAERLASGSDPRAAFEHFDVALQASDLRGLRQPSRVALAAASAARDADLPELAQRYARLAELDPDLADMAQGMRTQLPTTAPPSGSPSGAPSGSPSGAPSGPPKSAPAHPPASARRSTEFMSAKPRVDEPEVQTRPARRTQIGLGMPGVRSAAADPNGDAAAAVSARPEARAAAAPAPGSEPRRRVWGRPPRHVEEPSVRPTFEPRSDAERELFLAANRGSAEAGRALCAALLAQPERADDLAASSWLLSRLEPGARTTLEHLVRAAEATGDISHAEALEHVLGCTGPTPSPAPPLAHQHENVDVLRRLLFSDADGQYPEALEVIWQSTHRSLEWENVHGLALAERAVVEPREPLGRAWAAATRVFGLASTPLWRWRSGGDYRVNVIVRDEPGVLLSGEPPAAQSQLLYDLGAALAGTLPPFVILNAATYEQIDDLFRAIESAFGPPEASRTSFTSTARLAGLLWESLPPRTQRRMSEYSSNGKLTRESAVAGARRAARRAGLFVSGDLAEALGRVVADEGLPRELLGEEQGLARLCEASRAAADLVRLASDPVYAHLRWRLSASHVPLAAGRRGR